MGVRPGTQASSPSSLQVSIPQHLILSIGSEVKLEPPEATQPPEGGTELCATECYAEGWWHEEGEEEETRACDECIDEPAEWGYLEGHGVTWTSEHLQDRSLGRSLRQLASYLALVVAAWRWSHLAFVNVRVCIFCVCVCVCVAHLAFGGAERRSVPLLRDVQHVHLALRRVAPRAVCRELRSMSQCTRLVPREHFCFQALASGGGQRKFCCHVCLAVAIGHSWFAKDVAPVFFAWVRLHWSEAAFPAARPSSAGGQRISTTRRPRGRLQAVGLSALKCAQALMRIAG